MALIVPETCSGGKDRKRYLPALEAEPGQSYWMLLTSTNLESFGITPWSQSNVHVTDASVELRQDLPVPTDAVTFLLGTRLAKLYHLDEFSSSNRPR